MYIYMRIVYKKVPMNSKLKGNPVMDYHSIQVGFEILKVTETGYTKVMYPSAEWGTFF